MIAQDVNDYVGHIIDTVTLDMPVIIFHEDKGLNQEMKKNDKILN